MQQVKKSGIKQFFIAILLIFANMTFFGYVKFLFSSYSVIADILCLISMCILGFFILIRYGAVYTYTADIEKLKINRTIGKRNKEIEIPVKGIISVSNQKPKTEFIKNFSRFLLTNKHTCYVTYEKDRLTSAVIIEADDELLSYLKNVRKKAFN